MDAASSLFSSDDEAPPLQISSWGNQTMNSSAPADPLSGWHSLVDPNFKVKPGGLGSGNLHRKGSHYIPVPESVILQQRTNGGALPKKSKKKKKAVKIATNTTIRSTSDVRPADAPGGWGSGQLISTPFWETSEQKPAAPVSSGSSATADHVSQNQSSSSSITHTEDSNTFEQPDILFKLDIVLGPGVTIKVDIHEHDDPMQVVSMFTGQNKIAMTEEAKSRVASTLSSLMTAVFRKRQLKHNQNRL